MSKTEESSYDICERVAEQFHKDTGFMPRFKSVPTALWYEGYDEQRNAAWDKWLSENPTVFNPQDSLPAEPILEGQTNG